MEPVSLTAQWMAAARAVETERTEHSLLTDPLARDLAAPSGFELLERYQGGGLTDFIAIRTRYIDDAVQRLVRDPLVKQVVFVAAGMDTRSFRLDWPGDVVVYEVDHTALIEEKRARLDRLGARPKARRHEVGADLTGDWLPALTEAGFDRSRPTLWVTEGLLFFLEEDQVVNLLMTLHSVSAPGSRLVLDVLSRQMLTHPATRLFVAKLRSNGIPWVFGTDEPEEFLASAGWRVRDRREPGEVDAARERWQYPVQPEHVPAPRHWLVQADWLARADAT